MPEDKVRRALQSIWDHNFTPDVAPFRAENPKGRWFAMPGDGGTIMVSTPHSEEIDFSGSTNWSAQYFSECMSGFEHQFASHLLWERMVTEGLAVTRVIHDRYSAKLRNPYNEIECSDHYARSMASYGTYVAVCGFEYDGPEYRIGFAPRLTPEDFRAVFVASEGWGTFHQKISGPKIYVALEIQYGKLQLRTLTLEFPGYGGGPVSVTANGAAVAAKVAHEGFRITITLAAPVTVEADQAVTVVG